MHIRPDYNVLCVLLRLNAFDASQNNNNEQRNLELLNQYKRKDFAYNMNYEVSNLPLWINERAKRMKDFPFYKLLNVIIVIQFFQMNNSTVDKIVRLFCYVFFVHE